jgi:quercetin dioxygenase-like cupin family protein
MNRRDLLQSLPALALLPTLAAEAQNPAKPAATCAEPTLDKCVAFPFEGLPVRYSEDGALTHQILEGRIPGTPNPAGNVIELHETTLKPGKMPHPAHRHPHAELLFVRSGTIEFISDNPPVRVTAGGAAYCAPNQLHGFHNVGETEATYFVMKVGAEPVCQK